MINYLPPGESLFMTLLPAALPSGARSTDRKEIPEVAAREVGFGDAEADISL